MLNENTSIIVLIVLLTIRKHTIVIASDHVYQTHFQVLDNYKMDQADSALKIDFK